MAFDHGLHRPVASISSLPVEVLLIIFRMIINDMAELEQDINLRPSAIFFPSSVPSDVCILWKEIAITFPQFWTRLVVSLDSTSKPFTELKNYLLWSRNLSFELRLASPYHMLSPASKDEKSCLLDAMKTLSPYLHRCHGLHISVWRSSSLPPFSKILDSLVACEKLEILRLECRIHDACTDPCPSPVSPPVGWKFPPLKALSLSADTIFFCNQLSDPSPFHTVQELVLTNYDARVCPSGERGLTISSLIDMLGATQAKHITLDNLYFNKDGFFRISGSTQPMSVNCKDLQEDVILAICWLYKDCFIEEMTITSSPIADSVAKFPAVRLDLRHIPGGCFPVKALQQWRGSMLRVNTCPSFNDSVLEAMSKGRNGLYGCYRLSELYIHGCSNISIPALESLVTCRWEEARGKFEWKDIQEMAEHVFGNISPIVRLSVDDDIGTLFSEEDVEWFKSKLYLEIDY